MAQEYSNYLTIIGDPTDVATCMSAISGKCAQGPDGKEYDLLIDPQKELASLCPIDDCSQILLDSGPKLPKTIKYYSQHVPAMQFARALSVKYPDLAFVASWIDICSSEGWGLGMVLGGEGMYFRGHEAYKDFPCPTLKDIFSEVKAHHRNGPARLVKALFGDLTLEGFIAAWNAEEARPKGSYPNTPDNTGLDPDFLADIMGQNKAESNDC